MKLWTKLVAGTIMTLAALSAWAETPDPLWVKVVDNLKKTAKFVPRDIDTKMEIDKDGTKKNVSFKSQQTGWKDHEPTYTVSDIQPTPKDPSKIKPLDFEAMLKPMFRNVFEPNAEVKRTNGVKLNNVDTSLFELEQSGLQKFRVKVWANPETGDVYRYDVHAEMPLTMAFDMSITLAETATGVRLGTTRDTRFVSKVPFSKAGGHIVDTLSNWIPRQ